MGQLPPLTPEEIRELYAALGDRDASLSDQMGSAPGPEFRELQHSRLVITSLRTAVAEALLDANRTSEDLNLCERCGHTLEQHMGQDTNGVLPCESCGCNDFLSEVAPPVVVPDRMRACEGCAAMVSPLAAQVSELEAGKTYCRACFNTVKRSRKALRRG